jgi:2-polyprenyl-6-hydroxyphenyl methylase/3-demethylubiquinone-9 3-methyltransferase
MSTIDTKEINQFSQMAGQWWDEAGPYRILHELNPVRLAYLKHQICQHYNLPAQDPQALRGLNILDIGCGGGLITLPMAQMGASILGIDACAQTIAAAQHHAQDVRSTATFRQASAEGIALESPHKFDVVLAIEIIEHVQSPQTFIQACTQLTKPGGLVIMSTLTRTLLSFALGIVAAEYILRWVPKGTHSWEKFVQPAELSHWLEANGCQILDISGLDFDLWKRRWSVNNNKIVANYFLTATSKNLEI